MEPETNERWKELVDASLLISYYCAEHRDIFHRCNCPFEQDGICPLHYTYPDSWPDMRGMKK